MFFSFQHLPDSPCLTTYSTLFSLCFSKQNIPPTPSPFAGSQTTQTISSDF